MIQPPEKLTLKYMREQSRFAREAFARYAGISGDTQRKIEERIPVGRGSAQKALDAANRLLGTTYTLEQIDVALLNERQGGLV